MKYPEKVERRKGDRLRVQGVGTPPPDDTERASLSRATPSGFPKRTHGVLPYPDPLREKIYHLYNFWEGSKIQSTCSAFHTYFCFLVILLFSQSNSEDFSSEDERLGSSSLGVKKAG